MLDSRNFIVRTLLADGLITEADLRRATEHAMGAGGDLLDSMVTLGIATTRRLAIAKAKICEYPFVDLTHYDVDFRNTRLVPRAVAERLVAFPLFILDGVATVAMLDPLNLQAIDQIRQLLRCDVDPVVADADQLRSLVARAYSLARSDDGGEDDTAEQTLTTGDEPVVAAVNQILAGAAEASASDVHINPEERDLILRYRLDGVLAQQQAPQRSMHEALVQRLKVMAKLDLTQTRKPQDGKFRFRHKGENIDVRLSIIPTIHGENVVMRLLRSATRIGDIESLGMSPQMTNWFSDLIQKPHGIILVTGPTGSGKTTTLYTALNAINTPDVNIMTIEDPVEIRLPMIRQVQAHPEIGLTFASALRSFLRQDPDVILVGEIRDEETAKIAAQAAMTGHLVLSTLHTNDAVGTIERLVNMGVPPYLVGSTLLASLSQRLVRQLCTKCSVPETDFNLIRRVPPELRKSDFRTHAGCDACKRTGFRGRLAIFEMLRVTPRVRPLIEYKAATTDIIDAARADGFRSLFYNGGEAASLGRTSLDEIVGFSQQFLDDDATSDAVEQERAA
ncbi:MAG TPA: GspE/PulE family protein [Phycisphaerales bacterium]|nr:GspE/PulE family protein [Phycisphaerales bacterium]